MAEGQPRTRCSLQSIFARARPSSASALVILASLCLLSAGCTTPYRHAQLRPADAGFAGIDDVFGPQTPEVDVLLVHGMGTHDSSWVQTLVTQLAPALGFPPIASLPKPDSLKNGAQLFRITLTDSNRQLRIGAVLWSPVTSPAKATLCYDVTQKTSLCADSNTFSKDKRALANAYIKSQIMDDRLSDVTFYLNEDGGRLIREAIQDALLRSLSAEGMTLEQLSGGSTPTAKTAPLFLISESLGSKIVVDSLQEFENRHQTKEFAQQTRGNVHTLFLLANQIPILNLGVGTAPGGPAHYQHLEEFARSRNAFRNPRLPPVPLHVVAFSDPNDVFSYQLEANAIPREEAIISNVVVSNDHTVLGLYEDPDKAHTCYMQTAPVATAIAHGSGSLTRSAGIGCDR
jgi:hypothetical protein